MGFFFSGAIRWANTKTNSGSQMRAFWELAQLLGRAAHEQQRGKRSAFFLSSSLSCGCGGKTVWPATKSCMRDAVGSGVTHLVGGSHLDIEDTRRSWVLNMMDLYWSFSLLLLVTMSCSPTNYYGATNKELDVGYLRFYVGNRTVVRAKYLMSR